MADLLVFGSVLPAADRLRVERKLMTDHGIALPTLARDKERALHNQVRFSGLQGVRFSGLQEARDYSGPWGVIQCAGGKGRDG